MKTLKVPVKWVRNRFRDESGAIRFWYSLESRSAKLLRNEYIIIARVDPAIEGWRWNARGGFAWAPTLAAAKAAAERALGVEEE